MICWLYDLGTCICELIDFKDVVVSVRSINVKCFGSLDLRRVLVSIFRLERINLSSYRQFWALMFELMSSNICKRV